MSLSAAVILFPFLVLVCAYLHFWLVGSRYWARKNVPHLRPIFLLGNLWKANLFESFVELLARYHMENRKRKILGYWIFSKPHLLVTDPELMKRILIRDFRDFRGRGVEINEDIDPLAGHLFLLNGKRWRNLRVRMTPTFTSGRMKTMFPTVARYGELLRQCLERPAETGETVEVKDVLARYATDVISSCAFGIETNSLRNPKSEFRKYGKKIFYTNFRTTILNTVLFIYPRIGKLLKLRIVAKDITDFFIGAVRDAVQHRTTTETKRNDFLQFLIQLIRAGKIEDVDKTPVHGLEDEEIVRKFSLLEAAAQCFIFFAAGFELSSSALSFSLYELALNPDIQKRLQDEIDSALLDCNNEMTYETLQGMEYMDKVVQETLRKYPPVGNLQRQCSNDYYIPELDVTLDKSTTVLMSVTGVHRDPDLYPNPDKFDPERFSPEERAKRRPCTFLPFGDGPRNCIGSRFALMQIKVALFSILRDYTVQKTPTTPVPIKYALTSFIPVPVNGMPLSFRKRVRKI